MDAKWQAEKQRREMEKQREKFERIMNMPMARGEALARHGELQQQMASIALGLEAMETLLVEAKVISDNAVLDKIKVLLAQKAEQVSAADAVEAQQGTEPERKLIVEA